MEILVIGSGGREHAICAALAKSPKVTKLYCAPGNAGIAQLATIVPIKVMEFDSILDFALKNKIDLVFVAPDNPLAMGLVNLLEQHGVRCFGPTKEAAIIEGSKAFSKAFMLRHGIPTAAYNCFTDYAKASAYLQTAAYPLVIKADGLALGKGVIICADLREAEAALASIMLNKVFGNAGNEVVIEEYLEGTEATILAFTDGNCVRLMPSSQDHKKAYDGDKGLNTGGMGAFAPSPAVTPALLVEIEKNIIAPTVAGLKAEGRTFKGVIYFGLMLTKDGVKVIEYNARFGDPETQAVLPLLETDFADVVCAVADGRLADVQIEWKQKVGFCVVVASGGYPGTVVKGYPITIGQLPEDITVYHSGTAIKDGALVTSGGRVLCVTTVADSIAQARDKVYANINKISFTDCRYRSDIGIK